MIGRTIGHYRIVEKLGAGGMGEVYLADDTKLDRKVALKILPAEMAADGDRVQRFMSEAKAASALNHPNVCVIHEVGRTDDGLLYIAMEHIAGVTLEATLLGRELDARELIEIAIQVGEALDEAHDKGVIHRDIKPANIMITPRGQAKVLDFGLAKRQVGYGRASMAGMATETQTRTALGMMLGTVHYMSPEQALGRDVDHRSDIFSFGVVLYQMAARRRPFGGASAVETIDRIIHSEPEEIASFNKDVPPELARIIRKCLEKDRERRYQSARELVTDFRNLKRHLDSGPSKTVPLAPPAPRGKKSRRVAYGALAAALVGVVGLGLYFTMWRARPAGPPAGQAPPAPAVGARRLSDGALPSSNAEANDYYEIALQSLRIRFDIRHAIEMFEKALTLDPRFAEARAYHAFCQFVLIDGGYSNDASLLYNAENETSAALRDNPRSPVAHATRAAVFLYQGRKDLVPGAVESALKLDPESLDAKIWLLNYQQLNGDYGAAEALANEILRAAPLMYPARMNLAEFLRQTGNFAGAVRQLEKILEQDEQNLFAVVKLARAYEEQGDLPKARLALERARPGDRRNFQVRLAWAVQLALEGKLENARKEMDEDVLKYAAMVPHLTSRVAEYHAALHDATKSLEWLETAVRNGDERAEWFGRNPLFAGIRNEPRFKQILASIDLRRQARARAQSPGTE